MEPYKLGEMELRFAQLIWACQPVSSGELVRRCAVEFDWKKSTTYTMLKRLCDRGLFVNQKGTISALMEEEDYRVLQGDQFLQESFGGSLPRFLAAFCHRKKLTPQEVEQLRQMIDSYGEEE